MPTALRGHALDRRLTEPSSSRSVREGPYACPRKAVGISLITAFDSLIHAESRVQSTYQPCPTDSGIVMHLSLLLPIAVGAALAANDPIDFNRDVRPILSENCFYCHGQDAAQAKGDLRLDVRPRRRGHQGAGDRAEGRERPAGLVRRINAERGGDTLMRHRRSRIAGSPRSRRSCSEQLDRRGCEEKYQPHWAFVAPKRPELPTVRRTEAGSARRSIVSCSPSWRRKS